MKIIYYRYNDTGVLTLIYRDEYRRYEKTYLGCSLREAIAKFRDEHDLKYKHIEIKKLS